MFASGHWSEYLSAIFLVSSIDFITLIRTRLAKRQTDNDLIVPFCSNFSILVPIFGNISYLKNIDYLRDYGSRVILCTTTKESLEFNRAIKEIAQRYNFKIFRSVAALATGKHKPNPWRLFSSTLNSAVDTVNREIVRDEIIREGTINVTSKYCIFIDGDTVTRQRLDILCGRIKNAGYDLASVRVLVSKTETVMEKLQSVEYELAMDARRIYPWLTSGAGMIAKTKVIQDIMSHHSLFFSGGDIEIGKLAKMIGYNVGHIPFVFYTDVPSTFRSWFKQRMAWFGGGFRHAVVNLHQYTWKNPFFYIYTTIIVYLLAPIRIYEAIRYPWIIPVVVLIYWTLILIFHWQKKQWFYFLFPFYSLIQVLILVPIGYITYFRMAVYSDNAGFIRLRGKEDDAGMASLE